MAYTSNSPAQASYNNVISLGISYTWENGLNPKDSSAGTCPGITDINPEQYIKRTQSIDIEALNLDLSNAGGSSIANLAAAQNAYANTQPVSVYANGKFAGRGRLSSYSISEGSLTNSSVTNLGYTVEDGGPDKEDANSSDDDAEDPVSRTESITVSRDIEGKSYKIAHDYSISFGTNFDSVTDFPLYAGNAAYATVDGRLTLGAAQANAAVFDNVTNYGDYIDLSAYTLGGGFDLQKVNDSCRGVFYTSNATSDYINGDYSISKTTELRYTGSDVEPTPASYEVDYTMSFSEVPADGYRCAKVTMKGSVKGKIAAVSGDCSSSAQMSVGETAQSGYDIFVGEGKASTKLQAFYDTIKDNVELMGIYESTLNPGIINLKVSECNPAVDKGGATNDGTIAFEFEMDNCPNRGAAEAGDPYTWTESSTQSYSWQKDCAEAERKVTTSTVAGSVGGICGQQVNGAGAYERWGTVSSIYTTKAAAAKTRAKNDYNGDNLDDLELRSSSASINEYGANGSYSWTYSDAPPKCAKTSAYDKCKTVVADEQDQPATDIVVKTVTTKGIVRQTKGKTLPTKTVSLTVGSNISKDNDDDCSQDLDGFLSTTKDELNDRKPACVINSLSWTFTKQFDQTAVMQASMGGIDL